MPRKHTKRAPRTTFLLFLLGAFLIALVLIVINQFRLAPSADTDPKSLCPKSYPVTGYTQNDRTYKNINVLVDEYDHLLGEANRDRAILNSLCPGDAWTTYAARAVEMGQNGTRVDIDFVFIRTGNPDNNGDDVFIYAIHYPDDGGKNQTFVGRLDANPGIPRAGTHNLTVDSKAYRVEGASAAVVSRLKLYENLPNNRKVVVTGSTTHRTEEGGYDLIKATNVTPLPITGEFTGLLQKAQGTDLTQGGTHTLTEGSNIALVKAVSTTVRDALVRFEGQRVVITGTSQYLRADRDIITASSVRLATATPTPPTVGNCRLPVDVVYAVDNSGTMRTGSPTSAALMKDFVSKAQSKFGTGDRGAVISYSQPVRRDLAYTSDFASVTTKVSGLQFGAAGSDLGRGIDETSSYIRSDTTPNRNRIVVVLTDGRVSGAAHAADVALKDFANSKIHYYSIQLVASASIADSTSLKNLAVNAGGKYVRVKSINDVQSAVNTIFTDVTQTFTCRLSGFKYNDINGDGQKAVNEPGLGNWTIELLKADASGNYAKVAEAKTQTSGRVPGSDQLAPCSKPTAPGTTTPLYRSKTGKLIRLNSPTTVVVRFVGATTDQTVAVAASLPPLLAPLTLPVDLNFYQYLKNVGDTSNPPYACAEFTASTPDGAGYFTFASLDSGNYKLREVSQTGWELTTTATESTVFTMPLRNDQILFGNKQTNPLGITAELKSNRNGVRHGDTVVLAYKITNPSQTDATNVIITQPLPPNFENATDASHQVVFPAFELKAGQSAEKTVQVVFKDR